MTSPKSSRAGVSVLLGLAALIAAGIALALATVAVTPRGRADLLLSARIDRGERLYAAHCAACHGARGEGEAGWPQPAADGRVRAPPHDVTGHTWRHADADLLAILRDGIDPAMPGFARVLDDEARRAVLDYLKSRWPLGVRASQAMLNPDRAGLPAGWETSDWRLPPACRARNGGDHGTP